MASCIGEMALGPPTEAERKAIQDRNDRCCVCGEPCAVVAGWNPINEIPYRCDYTGWMRLQYPIPAEMDGTASIELELYCPKDAERAAGLLRELRAGNTRR